MSHALQVYLGDAEFAALKEWSERRGWKAQAWLDRDFVIAGFTLWRG